MPSIRPQWLPTVKGGCGSGCTYSCGGAGSMTYDYNADNQQTSMSDGAGDKTTYAYNGDGQQTQITDPLGNTTTNTYDAQGRLLSTTNALNGTVSYAYNLAGWKTSETDADGNITQYAYNAAGELASETNPLNYTQSFSYDAAGQLTAKTDYNGQQTEYAYNESGWKTSETWLNSQNQPIYQATFSYDPAGRLTEEQDPNSIYDYSYNASGQLTQTEVTYPSLSTSTLMTLSYGYDSFGNRTSLSDSLGGSLTYSYNGEHDLTGETFALNGTTGPQLSLSYDTQKRLYSITRTDGSGDTIVSTYSYDNAYRLTNMTYTDTTTTTTLASYSYGYNTASQVSSYQDANSSLTYSYDQTGQLTSASGTLNASSYTASWSYDANGNRNMSGYQIGSGNELMNDGTYSYTYDQNGNTLTKTNTATGDVWTYTWDYHNQMTEAVEKNSSGTVLNDLKYSYDVEGRLIGVEVNGTQQRWTVFDGANPYLDFNGAGTSVSERYVTNPSPYGRLYARVTGSGTADWYVTDRLGSVRLIVDTSGNVLDAIVYDPWGAIVSESNPSNGDRFKFEGGQYDSIQQTYLFTARWENPLAGRWESPDPLDLMPDSNPYREVGNDPTTLSDPRGLCCCANPQGKVNYEIEKWTLRYLEGKDEGKVIDLTKVQHKPGVNKAIDLTPGLIRMWAEVKIINDLKCPTIKAYIALLHQNHEEWGWEPLAVKFSSRFSIPPRGGEHEFSTYLNIHIEADYKGEYQERLGLNVGYWIPSCERPFPGTHVTKIRIPIHIVKSQKK